MASPIIIASTIEQGNLSYIGSDGRPVAFQIVAFAIEGNTVRPITWPAVPAKSKVVIRNSSGFQSFDLESGLAHGAYTNNLAEVGK